jgi:hypothetical protein
VVSPALRVEAGSGTILAGDLPAPPDRATSITQPGSSIVSTQVKRALTHATIVVDVRAAAGKSLRSVVYFASLVGLAEVRLGAAAPNSILGLFRTESNICELTVTHQGFLKALYAMNLDRRAEQHRRVLIGQIIRARTDNSSRQ